MPLGEFHRHLRELDSAEDIVLMCRSGQRSMQALEQLQAAGFKKVRNLRGGINEYAREVDSSIPTY